MCCCCCFSFQHITYFSPLSCLCGSWQKFNEILILVHLQVRCFDPLVSYNIFSFSLVSSVWIWRTWMYNFGIFNLLDVVWAFWICDLLSGINFGKFSAVSSNISSVPFSFFSFWYLHYTYVTPFIISPFLRYSVPLLLLLLLLYYFARCLLFLLELLEY